ncbi:hypothetical protein [Schauerella aestuarii]|uniref:hypothetical protein n=1 Tax=Schauerella aestuarii TaxID=2511204 RepID=UPI00136946B7|nr:hypothetical protein [Achromobacter aestuarii]MYZ44171.1 hypothetical protein [Achromobacter aestuarii]
MNTPASDAQEGLDSARLYGSDALMHQCVDARMHGCTDARMHGCADVPMYRSIDAVMHATKLDADGMMPSHRMSIFGAMAFWSGAFVRTRGMLMQRRQRHIVLVLTRNSESTAGMPNGMRGKYSNNSGSLGRRHQTGAGCGSAIRTTATNNPTT